MSNGAKHQTSTGQDRTTRQTPDETCRQDQTRPDQTGPDKTRQERTGQDRTDLTRQGRAGQDRTDLTRADQTGQDKTSKTDSHKSRCKKHTDYFDLLTNWPVAQNNGVRFLFSPYETADSACTDEQTTTTRASEPRMWGGLWPRSQHG